MPRPRRSDRHEGGQILVLFALGLIVLLAGVALVLEGGNAYQNQRGVQNGADAAANAGATVIARHLAGVPKTDAEVAAAVATSGAFNSLSLVSAYYTNGDGDPIDASGNVVAPASAVVVGAAPGDAIPTTPDVAIGIRAAGSRTFPTSFGKVIGFNTFTASAEAIAITGRVNGGRFLPVVFPVNITDCSGNGSLGTPKDQWDISIPDTPPAHPIGTEYIIPLCKTGGGSFMVLDLDGIKNNCEDEVTNPPAIQWDTFPVDVASDNGNNCAKQMEDEVNALHGETVLVPICDNNECNTSGGSHATYHITGVAAFWIDYMSDSNNPNNSLCQSHVNADGQQLVTIAGNGSSSCLAGYFVRFITAGPVGAGTIGNGDAIGIQLIK